jgi:N,N'-diacetylbacillosaminyl-diphospho-undecaprenol alpha-1,3-N-acetylgalactosaminyltransferase
MPYESPALSGKIIHLIPHPMGALRFLDPVVLELAREGYDAELWTEPVAGSEAFIGLLRAPKRLVFLTPVANPLASIRRLVSLWRRFRKIRPVCVHAHQTRGAVLSLIAAWAARVPVRIYHNHGSAYSGPYGLLRPILGVLEKTVCSLATHVLFVSPAHRDLFLADGLVSAEKSRVLGPGSAAGVDLDAFSPVPEGSDEQRLSRVRLGIQEGDFVVLYVGRPHRRKGFPFLLKAWRGAFASPGNTLILAGCEDRDVRAVLGADYPANIRAMGYCTNMRDLYAACDVMALPTHHEGFNYSLLEAAACARALVASDIPAVRVQITPNVEGFVHDIEDARGLVAGLERLKSDPDIRRRLGSNARAMAEKFDRRIIIPLITQFYRTLSEPKRDRSAPPRQRA